MVQIVRDREHIPAGVDHVELEVRRSSDSPDRICGRWVYGEDSSDERDGDGAEVAAHDAFADALRYAMERGVGSFWVNDPENLYPETAQPPVT